MTCIFIIPKLCSIHLTISHLHMSRHFLLMCSNILEYIVRHTWQIYKCPLYTYCTTISYISCRLFKCGNKWRLVWLIILCNTAHTTHTAQWALIFNVQVFNIYRISVSYKKSKHQFIYYNVQNKESTVTNKYDYFMCFSINIWYSVFIGAHKRY